MEAEKQKDDSHLDIMYLGKPSFSEKLSRQKWLLVHQFSNFQFSSQYNTNDLSVVWRTTWEESNHCMSPWAGCFQLYKYMLHMNLMNLIHQQLQVIKKITSQFWVAMLKLSVYISLYYYVVGNYKKCSSVTMETNTGNNYTCRSTCDVTGTQEYSNYIGIITISDVSDIHSITALRCTWSISDISNML